MGKHRKVKQRHNPGTAGGLTAAATPVIIGLVAVALYMSGVFAAVKDPCDGTVVQAALSDDASSIDSTTNPNCLAPRAAYAKDPRYNGPRELPLLMLASAFGSARVVQKLLSGGASLTVEGKNPPLVHALLGGDQRFHTGHTRVMEHLLDAGAGE